MPVFSDVISIHPWSAFAHLGKRIVQALFDALFVLGFFDFVFIAESQVHAALFGDRPVISPHDFFMEFLDVLERRIQMLVGFEETLGITRTWVDPSDEIRWQCTELGGHLVDESLQERGILALRYNGE